MAALKEAWQLKIPCRIFAFRLLVAKFLTPNAFRGYKEDDICGATITLSPQAAAEAVLRIPHALTPYYLRALRLEERYPVAEATVVSSPGQFD